MLVHQLPDIDVRKAVAVSSQHRFLPDIILYHIKALDHRGIQAGVQDGYPPVLGLLFVDFYMVGLQVHSNVGLVDIEIHKVILDYFPFVSRAEDEVMAAIMGILLHDMPKEGTPSDFCHGLWHFFIFFN